jgi:hypothetical protein
MTGFLIILHPPILYVETTPCKCGVFSQIWDNKKEAILYDKTKYKLRLLIENFFAKLKRKQKVIYAF